jgi:hypothetical protein
LQKVLDVGDAIFKNGRTGLDRFQRKMSDELCKAGCEELHGGMQFGSML